MQAEQKYIYKIEHLDCPDCAKTLEAALQKLPGVSEARISYSTAALSVRAQMTTQLFNEISSLAEGMGFTIQQAGTEGKPASMWARLRQRAVYLKLATMVVFITAAFIVHLGFGAPSLSGYLYLAAILVGGIPLFRLAGIALFKARKIDMNVLMAIAMVGAVALGEYTEGAVTLLLLTIGELLEDLAAERARRAISNLLSLAPSEATLVGAEGLRRVPTSSLQIGDILSIVPGERLPMDGTIVEGQSTLEEAAITGESLPVEKSIGATVFAGSINGQGALKVRVNSLAADNTLNRIIKLVEAAQSRQSHSERFIDRFASIYTPLVVAAAVLIAVLPPMLGYGAWREWIYRALIPLVVACPCALVLSTPVTMVSGLARQRALVS